MAQPVTFKQAEAQPLGDGKNPGTENMPYGLAKNPTLMDEEHKDMNFFVSKWRFSEEEKKDFRDRVFTSLLNKKLIGDENGSVDMIGTDKLLDAIVGEFDHVWLALMHTPVPGLILSQDPYDTAGYIEANPKHN